MTDKEYKEYWSNLSKLQIKMIEKNEECKHNQGDVFYYENPYKRPENVCFALLHVLDLYLWRVSLGFPSWESDNRNVFKIHCPSKKGTIWELKKIDK